MNLENYNVSELIQLYSQTIKELKKRGVIRTKNVLSELGEYMVYEYFSNDPSLPNLSPVPAGTKNIRAISQEGNRYSIKSTSNNVTSVFYGLQPPDSQIEDTPIFEFLIICEFDENYELEAIYQLTWNQFLKHKKWHSRMKAWNIPLTGKVIEDARIIYNRHLELLQNDVLKNNSDDLPAHTDTGDSILNNAPDNGAEEVHEISWNKTKKVNHSEVREKAVERIQKRLHCQFEKRSAAKYVTEDNESALFVLSATYSQKNSEYWYSINDENIPWLRLYPQSYVAFALGSADQILLFDFETIDGMLRGCLRTKEDTSLRKSAHYHIAFSVEGSIVYFKKKLPEHDFINVSTYLMQEP